MLRQIGLVDSDDPDGGGGGGGGNGGGGPVDPPPPPPAPGPPDPPPGPEPNPNPNPQGNPPPAPPGPPPSAIQGVQASDVTGGVQGSFAQAGSGDFQRRFGNTGPAAWFRNAARGPGGPPGQDRRATTQGGAVLGGGVAPTGPDAGAAEGPGGGQDAEWERFMREVQRQRFGGR